MTAAVDPYEFTEKPFQGKAAIQRKLRDVVCKRVRRHLWTPADAITFIPALSNRLYGDGRALMGLSTLNSRPRYYVLRIDSGWKIDMDPDAPDVAVGFVEYLDAIAFALEDEFGRGQFDDGSGEPETARERNQRRKWPAYDDENGSSWWRMDWPALPGVRTAPHPFNHRFTILQ